MISWTFYGASKASSILFIIWNFEQKKCRIESVSIKHQWFSGRIQRCHRWDPGSIPGWCIFFPSKLICLCFPWDFSYISSQILNKRSTRLGVLASSINGLVVESNVAIVGTRVQFPVDAIFFSLENFLLRITTLLIDGFWIKDYEFALCIFLEGFFIRDSWEKKPMFFPIKFFDLKSLSHSFKEFFRQKDS